jgi:hypothetical protein
MKSAAFRIDLSVPSSTLIPMHDDVMAGAVDDDAPSSSTPADADAGDAKEERGRRHRRA